MSTIRYASADPVTGRLVATLEARGARDTVETLRARVEAEGRVFIALSSIDLVPIDLDALDDARVAALVPPADAVVALPSAGEVRYDFAAGWLVPLERPTFEEAAGRTLAQIEDEAVAAGHPRARARVLARALKDEYDAHDPLERVFPAEASIEDIATAAVAAARRKAERRG